MTWTYNTSLIATNNLYQVRLLIGDVVIEKPKLQDEEINFALSLRPSVYGAAADCCRIIAAQYSDRASVAIQGMNVTYQNQAIAYSKRADEFDMKAVARGGGLPYAGGISISDKTAVDSDTDRMEPGFTIGQFDNPLPAGVNEEPETVEGSND